MILRAGSLGVNDNCRLISANTETSQHRHTHLPPMENMQKAVGAADAAASTRLYESPGVDHCEGGPGADSTDLLMALDQWVTRGVAPATLSAQKLDANGAVTLRLP
jgi:hypothetical protein